MGKSFRAKKDREMIKINEENALIEIKRFFGLDLNHDEEFKY